ncbi:MAG TPA: hypothetical protein VMG31_16735 [Verrucomicrobiae bacterium]|nr:hypothetical protein [Verrucomicrobiae bacterium]
MKTLRMVSGCLLLVAALAASLVAQSSDWQTLQEIPAGTKIKVKLKHRATFGHCTLEEVTDNHLTCYFIGLGPRRYARDEVRAVFLGRRSARTGFAIGAGAGAILGATRGCCGASGRLFAMTILVPVLGGIGGGIGAIADPFIDGKTIYRNDTRPPKPDRKGPHAGQIVASWGARP